MARGNMEKETPVVPEDLQPANLGDVRSATRELIAEDLASELGSEEKVHVPSGAGTAAPRVARKGAIKWGMVGTLVALLLAIGGGAYWWFEIRNAEEEEDAPKQEAKEEVSPVLAGDYRAHSALASERVRPTPEMNVSRPLVERSAPRVDLGKVNSRSDVFNTPEPTGNEVDASKPAFHLLSPEHKEELDDRALPTVTEEEDTSDEVVKLPGDRADARTALSPDAYPESGHEPIHYWTLLRDQLMLRNKKGEPEGTQIDLEKAWILLSLYYNPHLDIAEYRGHLSRLAAELYNRLVVIGRDGSTQLLGTERDRVKTVIEFMLQGGGATLGWDVQEFHPGIRGMGTAPQDQNHLIHEVFRNSVPSKTTQPVRNHASNTALNILTLVLLRKISHDLDGDGEKIGLNLPIYGMRLPDRTILRYDHRGANAILLSGAEGARDEVRSPLDFQSGTRIDLDSRGYSRNIEFIRNGNHYDAEDYRRRYQISDNDAEKGIYLRTLSDRRMFASLGYELAQAEIAKAREIAPLDPDAAEAHYGRASRFLTEWVLDRDDGSSPGYMRRSRYRSDHPQPRGDLLLRDAQILLAHLHLQRADYKTALALIENDHGLSSDPVREETLRGLVKHINGALAAANNSFEEVLKVDDKNPMAHLYLAEFAFLRNEASLPAIYHWRPETGMMNGGEIMANSRNFDIDHLGRAIDHFNKAEKYDLGKLNGEQRFVLHLHRGLAYEQRGRYADAIADVRRAGEVKPTYTREPSYPNIMNRLRYARVFEVLASKSAEVDGQLKYDAVAYLDQNLTLERSKLVELERASDAIADIDNLAVQWELVKVFKAITKTEREREAAKLTGAARERCLEGFGRDGKAWKTWIQSYFKQNP